MNSNNCKGCGSLQPNGSCAYYIQSLEQCPCALCLIKGICGSDCSEFISFLDKNEFYLNNKILKLININREKNGRRI